MSKISATLQAKLKKAREKFVKAEPAQSNTSANRKVPDGTYTAKLVGLDFAEFGKHPILRFTFEVTDADKKTHEVAIGQMVETRFNLDTDEGPAFIKRDFQKFGYDEVDDLLDDLEAANQLFIDLIALHPVCKINVAMDDTDQWQNVFLNDVLEMDEEEEEEEEVKPEPKKKGKGKKVEEKKEEPDEAADEESDGVDEEEGTEEEADEEAEEDDTEDADGDLEIGDMVEVNHKGKDVVGTVISIDEEASTVKVQVDKKRIVVPLENVYLLEG